MLSFSTFYKEEIRAAKNIFLSGNLVNGKIFCSQIMLCKIQNISAGHNVLKRSKGHSDQARVFGYMESNPQLNKECSVRPQTKKSSYKLFAIW